MNDNNISNINIHYATSDHISVQILSLSLRMLAVISSSSGVRHHIQSGSTSFSIINLATSKDMFSYTHMYSECVLR